MNSDHTSRPGPVGGFPTGSVSINGKRYSMAKSTLLAWGSRRGWQVPYDSDFYTFLYRVPDGTYFVIVDLPIPGDTFDLMPYPIFLAKCLFALMLEEKANLVTFEEAFPGSDSLDLSLLLAEVHTALSSRSLRRPHQQPIIRI